MTTVQDDGTDNVRRDLILGGVVTLSAMLLVVSASPALALAALSLQGRAVLDQALAASVVLNVALLLFSWRRYADLRREVVRRKDAEARLDSGSRRDPLTGLSSRQAFLGDAEILLRKSLKRERPLALLLIDLDHFKTINEVNGHAIGDETLRTVGRSLIANIPPEAIAARLGADEFAAVLPFDPARPDIVDAVAERLRQELGRRFEVNSVTIPVTVSIGVARTQPDCASIERLMRRADIAMFASKHAGRDRYSWFDDSMERELQMRNAIESGMREGIPLGQFVPFYEQQIDLTTGKLHGFEMLARWAHPTRGLIPPDIFIPIAEETGMIADLSMSVMRQAFEEAKNWDPSLTLAVNIAPSQLRDPWFAHKIVKLLVETGFPANRLEIEITESALVENMGVAQSVIGSLKNQGVRIALDDFGTGYSSLSNLRALPFDRVKIDRSFIRSLGSNAESAAVVTAITRLSDSLGLPVTAEGVETPEIEARLKTLGDYQGQGWHLGKPMDVEQVRTLLAERNLLPVRRLAAPAGERIRELRRLA
jgi:diguanylate cyclase (GGDEF)-like protein